MLNVDLLGTKPEIDPRKSGPTAHQVQNHRPGCHCYADAPRNKQAYANTHQGGKVGRKKINHF